MTARFTETAPIDARRALDPYVRWPVNARWAAAALIASAAVAARAAGMSFAVSGILLIAAGVLFYNAWLRRWSQHHAERLGTADGRKRFVLWQVSLDSVALSAAVYLSGGLGSPALFALIVPACCAALLLPAPQAWGVGTCLLGALALMGLAELAGWLPHQPLILRGEDLAPAPGAWGAAATLGGSPPSACRSPCWQARASTGCSGVYWRWSSIEPPRLNSTAGCRPSFRSWR